MSTFEHIKAIIFDLEGVIIDSEVIWDEIDRVFLDRKGATYNAAKTKHLMMGKNLQEGMEILKQQYGFDGEVDDLAEERRTIARELFSRDIQFISGFVDFYARIVPSYQTAIATSLERKFLANVDEKLHLHSLFAGHIYSIEDIGFVSKPNPDIFLHAARNLEVDPSLCLVIEDSPNGLLAAKRAGMKSIGITTSTTKQRLVDADIVVDSYDFLQSFLFPHL